MTPNPYKVLIKPTSVLSHLGLDIGIMVVLEQQCSRLGVVLAGGDVKRREADFTFGVMFQEKRDHLIMTLLQSNGQRSETILQQREQRWALCGQTYIDTYNKAYWELKALIYGCWCVTSADQEVIRTDI